MSYSIVNQKNKSRLLLGSVYFSHKSVILLFLCDNVKSAMATRAEERFELAQAQTCVRYFTMSINFFSTDRFSAYTYTLYHEEHRWAI